MGNMFLPSNSVVKRGKIYKEDGFNQIIKIYSYDPSKNSNPVMNEYHINTNGMPMVLDALCHIRQKFGDVSFRSSCKEGICGSCGMNINGENVLACSVKMSKYRNKTIYIRPLPHMRPIKDLVVDMSVFFDQYKSVKPWIVPVDNPDGREIVQSPSDRAKLDGLYDCILCACCSTSCPNYWWNQDRGFLGPAALLAAQRWIEDSRDKSSNERLKYLDSEQKLYRCHTILNCIHSCPKSLNPAKAISKIKRKMENTFPSE